MLVLVLGEAGQRARWSRRTTQGNGSWRGRPCSRASPARRHRQRFHWADADDARGGSTAARVSETGTLATGIRGSVHADPLVGDAHAGIRAGAGRVIVRANLTFNLAVGVSRRDSGRTGAAALAAATGNTTCTADSLTAGAACG